MPKRKKSTLKQLRKSVRSRKLRKIKKGGITLDPTLSQSDLRDRPAFLRGFTAGTDNQKLDRIQKRRDLLLNKIKGKGGLRVRFKRPGMLRNSPGLAKLYDPRRAGRPREHYVYFVDFEFTIIQSFDQNEPKTEAEARAINQIDKYEILRRYFSRAELGAKAGWTPRPPTASDNLGGTYNVTQTWQSYKKHGLDKKKLRELIKTVDFRLKGFAVVTGIRGVWRTQFSIESEIRKSKARGLFVKAQVKAKGKPRKPKRSKRI